MSETNESVEIAGLKAEIENMKKLIRQLVDRVKPTSESPMKLRSSHPPMILEKDTNYEMWRQIVDNELKSMNLLHLINADELPPVETTTE